MNYTIIEKCRVCGNRDLVDVITFQPQYLSPTFVKSNMRNELSEIKIPLTVVICSKVKDASACGLAQLKETTNPELLYTDYFYRSSATETMKNDLRNVVETVLAKVALKVGDVVVDIAANDGTMISFFPDKAKRFGVEPAKNIDWSHLDSSITIVNDYFSKEALIAALSGEKVKIFTCCAMFYDLEDPNSFVADVKDLLAADGVWCIQLSYLLSMIENMNFYDICHEHLEYYSLETLSYLMERNGLTIYDAELNGVNGGSARVFITHTESAPEKTAQLKSLLSREYTFNLKNPLTLTKFDEAIERLSKTVRAYLKNEISRGNRVIGLGASTKGNVLLQLFGINKEMLPYISEIAKEKIGLRTLGSDIELISDEDANLLKPSVKLVLPWYFKREIIAREKPYLEQGGRLLFPMPYAHIVSLEGETNI
jgi:hypothetical protein